MRLTPCLLIIAMALPTVVRAQNSSLMRSPMYVPADGKAPAGGSSAAPASTAAPGTYGSQFSATPPRESARASTRAIESMSMIALSPVAPRKFKTHDLITIVVQQQKKYEADGILNTKKEWKIDGKLEEWFHFYPQWRLGSDKLQNGKPGYQLDTKNENKMNGQNEREDRFITRIQATIIDVKPNGNLVLEASMEEQHDEEHFTITLTGSCRSEDVTPNNTILSTQIANLVLVEKNKGAVRDATTRGWFPRILDFARPF